jgi:hypothetical protein
MTTLNDKLNELARECVGLIRREALEVINGQPTGEIVPQLNTREAHEETRKFLDRAIALAVKESGAVEAAERMYSADEAYGCGFYNQPDWSKEYRQNLPDSVAKLKSLIANGERDGKGAQ